MDGTRRIGVWITFAGVVLQPVGFSWDAVLHHLDPDLATREGLFTLANPSHLFIVVGLGLTAAGVLWTLFSRPGGSGRPHQRAGVVIGSIGLVLLLGVTGGIAAGTGGIGGGHHHGAAGHVHDEPVPSQDRSAVAHQHAHAVAPANTGPVIAELHRIMHEHGTERALSRLQDIVAAEPTLLPTAHDLAHTIGRLSLARYGSAVEAFGHCRETFQAGCYHGVLEAHFEQHPTLSPADLPSLCSRAVGEDRALVVRFECLHGLGHGLTMHFEHDLMQALRYCDELATEWDRSSCYGGAFMENIVYLREQLRQGAGEPGSRHGSNSEGVPQAADPHYPCDILAERYLQQCYGMQSSAMLLFNGGDFARAFQECQRAPTSAIAACHESLGRDANAYTLHDIGRSVQICLLAQVGYQQHCFAGALINFIAQDWKIDRALQFCGTVPADAKPGCYTTIGEQVAVHTTDQAARATECAKVEQPYADACTDGAQLPRRV